MDDQGYDYLFQKVTYELFRVCPFCGEQPNVLYVPKDGYDGQKGWCVECKDMGCIFGRSSVFLSYKSLLDYWNRRA